MLSYDVWMLVLNMQCSGHVTKMLETFASASWFHFSHTILRIRQHTMHTAQFALF